MRFYRSNEPELWEDPEPVFRDDRLRELVDKLPPDSRAMIERVYFGQATVAQAARELAITNDMGQRALNRGLEALRADLQGEE